jgi:2-phosphoglycerate kinase
MLQVENSSTPTFLKKINSRSKIANIIQPFYGDLLARSLLRIGVPKFEAYEIAHGIWKKVSHKKNGSSKILKLVVEALKKKHPALVKRYQSWRKILKSPKPLILLIGGGTGIGTSTLAVRLAWLLEINRVVSTDSVREIVRHLLPNEIIPTLKVSTFEAGETITQVKSPHDRLIYGFVSQSRKVLFGIEALIDRSIREGENMIIEGVHLIPGELKFLKPYAKQATIISVMLDVGKKDKHRQHFFLRNLQNSRRSKKLYLKYFREIRLIRDFLVERAKSKKVPVVENYDLRQAEKEILDLIYSAYFKGR